MKNNSLFNKIILYIIIALTIFVLILFILGKFNRIGYLSDFNLVSEENGNYSYNFRIKYYSKIFRNSDIYCVYLNIDSLPDYIKYVKFEEKGSPFGNLISSREILEEKIDNIEYNLNIKFHIFIILILFFLLFYINYKRIEIKKYITSFFNKYRKLILKTYLISIAFVIFIFILLFLLSKISYRGSLENFELLTETKAGYVYRAKLKSNGLFSPNFIYEYSDKPLQLKDKPYYIKNYGYSIEIIRMPDWYNKNPKEGITASVWNNEDGTFTVSNSTSWNTYNYLVPLSIGEKYRTSIEIKRLSNYSEGAVTYYLDTKNQNIYIPNTENITDEYKIYSGDIEIKEVLTNEYPLIFFSYPKGIFSIKSIKVEQISDNLYLKNGSEVIITSYTNIDSNESINNIRYYLKLKYGLFIKIILLGISIYILKYFIFSLFQSLSVMITYITHMNRCICILIIFMCFLIMPNIIYKVFYNKFDHTNYENRNFSEKPKLDFKKLGNYPKLYETHFNDYIPFKNELTKLKNVIDLFVFKDLISYGSLLCKEKWLLSKELILENYTTIDRYKYRFTNEELEKAKNILLNFRDELKKQNIDFIFMICPYKESIYTNYIPSYIKIKTELNMTEQFLEYIEKNTDIKISYPKEQLIKYKDKYQLYYKYDHHWNALGAYVAYSELMKLFSVNVKDLESLNILNYDYRYRKGSFFFYNQTANNFRLSDLKYFRDDNVFVISNFISSNTNIMINNNNFDWWSYNYYYTNNNYITTNNVYIIRDSMFQELLDYIFPSFKETTVVSLGRFDKFDVIKQKPDTLIYSTYESDLKDEIFNVIPNYKIEEINRNIN